MLIAAICLPGIAWEGSLRPSFLVMQTVLTALIAKSEIKVPNLAQWVSHRGSCRRVHQTGDRWPAREFRVNRPAYNFPQGLRSSHPGHLAFDLRHRVHKYMQHHGIMT